MQRIKEAPKGARVNATTATAKGGGPRPRRSPTTPRPGGRAAAHPRPVRARSLAGVARGLVALVVALVVLVVGEAPGYAAAQENAPRTGIREARDHDEGKLEMAKEKGTRAKGRGKLRVVRAPEAEPKATVNDAIALLLNLGFEELRELPEATNLRAPDQPISRENRQTLDQISECINDLVICAANLVERDLSPEEARPFREHVRKMHLRRFGLDADSERHARAALVALVENAAESALPEGAGSEPTEGEATTNAIAWIDSLAAQVLHDYAADYPDYAARLSTPKKREALAAVIGSWRLVADATDGVPRGQKWSGLEALGRGVFAKNRARDWRDNVWAPLRALMVGDDTEPA